MLRFRSVSTLPLSLVVALVAFRSATAGGRETPGEQIWVARCAGCHGPGGEGQPKKTRPLQGDKSVSQLADVIRETMPEDDPGSLSVDESRRVAAFVHEAFYSQTARERNRPARIELARLTARQHRLVLTDLVGSFRGTPWWGTDRGLRGTYFSGRNFGEKGKVASRTDAQVNFQFGPDAPLPEVTEPHQFSIRWNGSLLAPDTGEYEFVVKTEHATRLWINEDQRPLIDAWVKSGNDTEYRGSVFLTGGRIYSLRLEFTKAKQGVDDSKNQKEKPVSQPASIALQWKRPGRVLETIPTRNLSPNGAPEAFVCAAPFPADDRSYGWVRGTAVSKAWDEATTAAALEATTYLSAHLREFAGGGDQGGVDGEKLKQFCRTFAERAFRRPLSDELTQFVINRPLEAAGGGEAGFKRVCLLILKSPRFLYREVGGSGDAWDTAARLSFGLWDSVPDEELRKAAAEGKLSTADEIRQQCERMVADQRARSKLREFLFTWLKVQGDVDLTKAPEKFPEFDGPAIADLRTSLELFLDDILGSNDADFRRLLLDDRLYVNERLAKLYGVPAPGKEGFEAVAFESGKRAGVLTHPFVLAALAHTSESSPIHRGVFLARGVLGQNLKPPPEAVAPLPADLHPDLTTRERVVLQTQPASCMTCHGIINPLGFTLEQFDAIGRYRELDRQKPVDSTGHYSARDGRMVKFEGARKLAEFLADSDETQLAFTEQLLHDLVQQSASAYGAESLNQLREKFAAGNFNIRKLAVEIMVATAGVGRNTRE